MRLLRRCECVDPTVSDVAEHSRAGESRLLHKAPAVEHTIGVYTGAAIEDTFLHLCSLVLQTVVQVSGQSIWRVKLLMTHTALRPVQASEILRTQRQRIWSLERNRQSAFR